MKLSIWFILFLTGCGPIKPQHTKVYQVDIELEIYVKNFEIASQQFATKIQIDDLKVEFGETKQEGKHVVGYCQKASNSTPRVVIQREYWDSATNADRELIIFHELGHCILNREHDNLQIFITYWMPKSIMNEYLFDDWIYSLNRDYYLKELFLK